jgi:GTP pyrophosphokinase
LEKELRRLGVKLSEREELAKLFKYDNLDDFLAAVGYGGVTTHQIAVQLAVQQEQPKAVSEVTPSKPPVSAIQVLGVGDLLTQLAKCCHPVPSDRIIGYITRSRGVTIHRQDCHSVIREDEKERLISVEWRQTDAVYPVSIQVEAWDRVGLMRDVGNIVAEEKINIADMNLVNHDDQTISLYFTLEMSGLAQLSRLLARIEGIRGVMGVIRIDNGATAKASKAA